ncbi:MAG: ABC transporter permease, partial [Rhodopirellula bahusiensis]
VMVSVVNAVIAMTASLYQERTSMALMTTYVALIVLYVVPPGMRVLASTLGLSSTVQQWIEWTGVASPFSALFSLPMGSLLMRGQETYAGQPALVIGYFACSLLIVALAACMIAWKLRPQH